MKIWNAFLIFLTTFICSSIITVFMFKKWNITSFNGITVPAHVALKPLEYSVLPRVEWYVDLYHPIGDVCLRKWNRHQEYLAHIHIGKSGGTTLDRILYDSVMLNGYEQHLRPSIKSYSDFKTVLNIPITSNYFPIVFWFKHHDMYYINKAETDGLASKLTCVGFIRNPVDREISQFHYSQRLGVLRQDLSLADWIRNMVFAPVSIKGTSALFADGSGGVMWFAGLATESWINSRGLLPSDYATNGRRLLEDPVGALRQAVRNFHRHFLWVGILEEFEASLRLLSHQTNLTFPPESFTRQENHLPGVAHYNLSAEERMVLSIANPMDIAFYTYVRAVQRARMQHVKGTVKYCSSAQEWEHSLAFSFYFNGTKIWPP